MKRTIIGGILMLSGVLSTLTIIFAAAIYAPSITSWSGSSKIWFAIFGSSQYEDQSLFLGAPFIIGMFLTAIGFLILVREYFSD